MSDLKRLTALTAINNMLAGGHFNICTIDRVADMLGIQRSGSEAYQMLGALHCIDYAKMPAEVRDAIPGLIEQVLDIKPAFQFSTMSKQVIDMAKVIDAEKAPEPKRGIVMRLLGAK